MNKLKAVVFLSLLSVASIASAVEEVNPNFQIGEEKLIEINSGTSLNLENSLMPMQLETMLAIETVAADTDKDKDKVTVTDAIKTTRELVALGKDVYELVTKGRSTVTESTEPLSVLPRAKEGERQMSAMELAGWSVPVTRHYRYEVHNLAGAAVVEYEFVVIFTPGGNLDGHGRYLTGVQVRPTYVKVLFPFDFASKMSLQTISNAGTAENPVATAVVNIEYETKILWSYRKRSRSFYLTGEGALQEL